MHAEPGRGRLMALYFLSLLLASLALVPAGAHAAELPHKLGMGAADYRTVQQIYAGWSLFGIVVIGAIVSTLLLALALRDQRAAFTPAVVALACLAATQVVFWVWTFPVNQATANWTVLPDDWTALRTRWELSHAASAALNATAVVALIVSVLRSRLR